MHHFPADGAGFDADQTGSNKIARDNDQNRVSRQKFLIWR
jgi:hypothetical protein